MNFTKKNLITAGGLVSFAIISRLLIHGQNWETLTAVTVVAAALLGSYFGFVVALLSVIGSDSVIGNTPILMFTWTAWAMIGLSNALWHKSFTKRGVMLNTFILTASGLMSTLGFYFWTNFGVWLTGPNYPTLMYPMTWNGLVQCYVMALPFLRHQLIGNLVIVPVVAVVTMVAYRYLPIFITKHVWATKPLLKIL